MGVPGKRKRYSHVRRTHEYFDGPTALNDMHKYDSICIEDSILVAVLKPVLLIASPCDFHTSQCLMRTAVLQGASGSQELSCCINDVVCGRCGRVGEGFVYCRAFQVDL